MFDFFYKPTTKRYDKVKKCVKNLFQTYILFSNIASLCGQFLLNFKLFVIITWCDQSSVLRAVPRH